MNDGNKLKYNKERKNSSFCFLDNNITFSVLQTCATFFIVDALIATTALYVGLAMLGHVQSDHGSAILTRKVAFITFVISDAITLISSFSSALVAFVCWMNLKRNGNLNKSQKMALLRDSGTMLALIAMVLAHISGTYALYGIKLPGAVTIASFCFLCYFAS